jgi:hypothetical protein
LQIPANHLKLPQFESRSQLGEAFMRLSSGIRVAFTALAALIGAAGAAQADCGNIRFSVLKAGWVVGGSGGSGSFTFHGRTYPISIGGISAGFVFGASETNFRGTVCNITSASQVPGAYGAAGAGAAVGVGGQAIVLRNEKGATLNLVGRQVGLQINADLSGLAISFR